MFKYICFIYLYISIMCSIHAISYLTITRNYILFAWLDLFIKQTAFLSNNKNITVIAYGSLAIAKNKTTIMLSPTDS